MPLCAVAKAPESAVSASVVGGAANLLCVRDSVT